MRDDGMVGGFFASGFARLPLCSPSQYRSVCCRFFRVVGMIPTMKAVCVQEFLLRAIPSFFGKREIFLKLVRVVFTKTDTLVRVDVGVEG